MLCGGKMGVAPATAAPTPPRKRWQGHAHGRFTPVFFSGKDGLEERAASPQHYEYGFNAIYARRTTAPQGAAHQLKVRSQGSLLVPSCQFGGYAANSSFIIHHSSLAYGPVDACSCFCEADVNRYP